MRTRVLATILLTLLLTLISVGCDQSNLGRSCGGEPVLVCPAHEWAEIREATLTPDELTLGDVTLRAQIRVELERCEMAPAPHEVAIQVLVPEMGSDPDAGSTALEVFNLVTIRDGEDGDPVAGDDVIEVDVANPFTTGIPAERNVQLRFEAISRAPSGCGSGAISIPYRTGATP